MWDEDITHTESVRPLAELLRATGQVSVCPVRDVATVAELERHLGLWLAADNLPVLYLACHGAPGSLWFGTGAEVTLDAIADVLGGRAIKRKVHISACDVLDVGERELTAFCRRSGVTAISGYTKRVNWTISAAFDLIVLGELLSSDYAKPAYRRLTGSYPDMVTKLGLRMATRTWAAPGDDPGSAP